MDFLGDIVARAPDLPPDDAAAGAAAAEDGEPKPKRQR
jgi:hypothetical protein